MAEPLRAAVDFTELGERSITVDCDVLQADGGTRTASITGGFVALAMACRKLVAEGLIEKMPLHRYISAVSVGVVDGVAMADLCYEEDSAAEVDMNIIMTDEGNFVEVQGHQASMAPLRRNSFWSCLRLAERRQVS